jgi:ATP-dependent protease ClpP protease subunit
MLKLALMCAMALCMLGLGQARAMEFQRYELKDASGAVYGTGIYATGEIVPGDAARLKAALVWATPDPLLGKLLFLDSNGGDAYEALTMADVMDKEPAGVSTVVPSGASCASACAAVLFISGRYRYVGLNASLGFHECFDVDTRGFAPPCNKDVELNADAHGAGGIRRLDNANADQMIWLDRDGADCWGLERTPSLDTKDHAPCLAAAEQKAAQEFQQVIQWVLKQGDPNAPNPEFEKACLAGTVDWSMVAAGAKERCTKIRQQAGLPPP